MSLQCIEDALQESFSFENFVFLFDVPHNLQNNSKQNQIEFTRRSITSHRHTNKMSFLSTTTTLLVLLMALFTANAKHHLRSVAVAPVEKDVAHPESAHRDLDGDTFHMDFSILAGKLVLCIKSRNVSVSSLSCQLVSFGEPQTVSAAATTIWIPK